MPQTIGYKYIAIFALLAGLTRLTAATVPDRITRPVDANRTTTLIGNVQREARPQFDRGPVDPAMPMRHMVLIVQPSGAQQGELDQLLADQQNPSSPRYRQWLSPEEFGDRFGLSRSDHSKVVAWLVSAGFTVNQSGRGRNWIAFSGAAGQVSRAFHTPIDRFTVNGEDRYANTAPPSVPEALAGVVGGFLGFSNFRPHSMIAKITPEYTNGITHYLAPQDWATIYDVAPLYQAGINGAGQSIAVVGASDVSLPDIQAFRKRFGLPANDPQMVQYADDPGFNGAEIEGDLDLEWAGAIAPNATIYYVFGDDVFTAVVVAVDMNVAPVVTMSYGNCEIGFSLGFWRAIAQQANAQGITILNSSGDAGAAGCDGGESSAFAVSGLTVDFPASLPEVTGVGGTQFLDLTGTYWANRNSTDLGSALSYIPEAAWNESGVLGLAAGGGGASTLYSKPLWQTGPGVPNDNARDVPDVAFSTAGHDGYLIDSEGTYYVLGGTSCSSPSFAGVVALLNQYLASKGVPTSAGLGNINPQLYRLAQTAASAFHDVTTGSNIVSCAQGSPDCLTGSFGYQAGAGYDQASGLGSVDVNQLFTQWNTQTGAVSVSFSASASTATLNDTLQLTATVKPASGQGTPTGNVAFSVNGIPLGTVALSATGGQQEAQSSFPAYLAGGTGPALLVAQYSGDTTFSPGGATQTINVQLPANAAAVVPFAPDTVWAAAPDAQGLSWSTTIGLQEFAGYPALVTGFSIDGAAQPLAQYLPSPTVAANGFVSVTVVQRNLTTPSVHTFGFTGFDGAGNTWSRQVSVNFLGLPPGSLPNVTATPLVVAQNPTADPSCQWPIQLNIDEVGSLVGLEVTNLLVGQVDWSTQIPSLFGTVRLAPWADLQGTICLSGIDPPATENIVVVTDDQFQQEIAVSLVGPAANPTKIAVTPPSVTMNAAGAKGLATLAINPGDPTAAWTASVFPANRTTSWLGASQFSGTGSANVALTASGAGFEPGVYRANLVIQCPTAVPQTVVVPIMFVNGPNTSGMAISSVANSATYSAFVSPGMVVAVFGSNLSNKTDLGSGNPLPYSVDGVSATVNGIAAPMVYVSPTQVNLQIPYEAGSGPAVLGINNNGQIAGFQFSIAATAPGIFADTSGNLAPTSTVTRGGIVTLYMTGAGEVNPQITTGYGPSVKESSLFQPWLPLSVTVGGTEVLVVETKLTPNQFGTTQVSILVPPSVPAGVQPVVVTVGSASSPPANVTVQ
jgi:uncharacterized protein (TIGR03437 family)